jgi:rhamnosyltransferase
VSPVPTVISPRSAAAAFEQLAAILVVYNQDVDLRAVAQSVLDVAGLLVIVDNAAQPHPAVAALPTDPRMVVLRNGNQGGLAGAYNAARQRLAQYAPMTRWVTFIDEDTDVSVLAQFLADPAVGEVLGREDTAAVAPAHRDRATGLRARHLLFSRWHWRQLPREQRGIQRVSFVINSMSVWRAQALQCIGAQNEWLAVDHVDTEYCLRAARLGLHIYLHGDHEFAHSIGARREYRLLGHRFQSGGHTASRRHNIGRANAWLAWSYAIDHPAFAALRLSMLLYEALGILVVEDDKARKLAALASGAVDGFARALRRAT